MPPAGTTNPKKAGRRRRACGWTLLTLGLLIAAAWGASGFSRSFFACGRYQFELFRGRFSVNDSTFQVTNGISLVQKEARGFDWIAVDERWESDHSTIVTHLWLYAHVYRWGWSPLYNEWIVSLWPLPMPFCAAGGPLLWSGTRARRRAMAGRCVACGYNLAGLAPNAPCPECGKGTLAT